MKQDILYKKLETPEEIIKAKELILEYKKWLDVYYVNVIEEEIKTFPKKFIEPDGTFIIAKINRDVVGCIALSRLDNDACEMKRLYVKEEYQGQGIGKILVDKIIEEAKRLNYKCMRLDTLKIMERAMDIYIKIGFYKIDAYYNNPNNKDAIYLEKKLMDKTGVGVPNETCDNWQQKY